MAKINVKDTEVGLISREEEDYISLTDIAKYKDIRTEVVIQNWIRSRMTIELLGLWETLYNPNFKQSLFIKRFYPDQKKFDSLYKGFEVEMTDYGIGTIPEIFDGDPPHRARGAISQAWSVAELLRISWLIKKYDAAPSKGTAKKTSKK